MSRGARAVLGLVLVAAPGCVRDAIVAREPTTDAATDGPRDEAARPELSLQVVVMVTDRDAARAELMVTVSATLTADGAPATAEVSITGGERDVVVTAAGGGRYTATFDDYRSTLALLVRADGVTRTVPLAALAAHAIVQPTRGQRIARGADIDVRWSPAGGADATIVSPEPTRTVPDNGAVDLPPGAFGAATGAQAVRLRRSTTTSLREFAAGSSLRTEIVRSVTIEIE